MNFSNMNYYLNDFIHIKVFFLIQQKLKVTSVIFNLLVGLKSENMNMM